MKKQRAATAILEKRQPKRIVARQPKRKPGQLRFQKLLEALDQLLAEYNVQDVGLYQIAAQARVPAASIYHFFPSSEAALLALAEFHHKALFDISVEPLPTPPVRWQDLFRIKLNQAAVYHNEHPAALRLFLGANISIEVKSADISQMYRLVEGRMRFLDHYFRMPDIVGWRNRLATYFAVVDGVFSLSYSESGLITEEYMEEAHRAGVAYLRCFLPEMLMPQESSGNRTEAVASANKSLSGPN